MLCFEMKTMAIARLFRDASHWVHKKMKWEEIDESFQLETKKLLEIMKIVRIIPQMQYDDDVQHKAKSILICHPNNFTRQLFAVGHSARNIYHNWYGKYHVNEWHSIETRQLHRPTEEQENFI